MPYRVAVAVSGRGSNLTALVDDLSTDDVARVVLAISDRQAPALAHAAARGIAAHRLDDYRDASEWMRLLDLARANLLVLAGYLKLVPSEVVGAWAGRIINIHPALLPLHGGSGMYGGRVHAAVLAAGDPHSGATVHLVDEIYDRGAVLGAGRVAVTAADTAETLAERVLAVEHRLLPAAVRAAAGAGRPVPFEFT
ncbi:MAG: phosphoribosylglycinamide formyltransferase [Gemmatimonadales bacterium]|nr:phosphoribosylglycinamide formyltransferase [Gemmatimonadales bacterium]